MTIEPYYFLCERRVFFLSFGNPILDSIISLEVELDDELRNVNLSGQNKTHRKNLYGTSFEFFFFFLENQGYSAESFNEK